MIERKTIKKKMDLFLVEKYISDELDKPGYSHTEIQRTPLGEKILIYTSKPGLIVGRGGSTIKELTEVLKKRFKLENPQIEVNEINSPFLDASSVARSIVHSFDRFGPRRFKLTGYRTLKSIMDAGALGAEIVIAGRGVPSSRSRTWRFSAGYLKKSGDISENHTERGMGTAHLKSGSIGIKVSILTPDVNLPDKVKIYSEEPIKVEEITEKVETKVEEKAEAKVKAATETKTIIWSPTKGIKSFQNRPLVIHAIAVATNIIKTIFSFLLQFPRFLNSSVIMFLSFSIGFLLSNLADVVMYIHNTKRETPLIGTPTSIQSKKIISTPPTESLRDAKSALGAVPIIVAIPPRLAAYATLSIKHVANLFFCATSTCDITAIAIGRINRVVAVFVIQALMHPVTIMNPKMIFFGFVPTIFRVLNANRL